MKTKAPLESRTKHSSCSIVNTTAVLTVLLGIAISDAFAGLPSNQCSITATGLMNCSAEDCRGGIVVGNGVHAKLTSGGIHTSVDHSAWTERPLAFRTFLRAIEYGNGLFVAVGGSYFDEPGVIVTSRDGIRWVRRNLRKESNLYSVTFDQGMFVAVGDAGAICSSVDGVIWKRQCSGVSVLLATVVSGNGIFVAGGESGVIVASTNGVNWTAASLKSSVYVGTIHFHGGTFIVRDGSATFTSTDGLAWRRRNAETTAGMFFNRR